VTLCAPIVIKNILFSLTFFISEKENNKKEIAEKNGEIIPTSDWIPKWEKDNEITKHAEETAKKLKEITEKYMANIFEIFNEK
jgi:hypothetical protein